MVVNQSLQPVIADVDHATDIYHFFGLGGRPTGDSRDQSYLLAEKGKITAAKWRTPGLLGGRRYGTYRAVNVSNQPEG